MIIRKDLITGEIKRRMGQEGNDLISSETNVNKEDFKRIPLSQGKWAIVDVEDYDWLMQWVWYAHKDAHSGDYYAVRNKRVTEGKSGIVRMHAAICGTKPGEHTDHEDLDKLNNRRSNLRTCTVSQNGANRQKIKKNTSGYKGVRLYSMGKRSGVLALYITGKSISWDTI